jgi:cathepsin D
MFFTLIEHHLVAATTMTSGLVTAPVSGIMGLAFESISSTKATPFWQAVTSQFSAPEMSFWLARDTDPTSVSTLAPGGVLTLGGTNTTLFSGEIEFNNLPSTPTFWLLSLSSNYSV